MKKIFNFKRLVLSLYTKELIASEEKIDKEHEEFRALIEHNVSLKVATDQVKQLHGSVALAPQANGYKTIDKKKI